VVALTALPRDQDRKRALAAGFFRYLVKPAPAGELGAAVAAAVEVSRARGLAPGVTSSS